MKVFIDGSDIFCVHCGLRRALRAARRGAKRRSTVKEHEEAVGYVEHNTVEAGEADFPIHCASGKKCVSPLWFPKARRVAAFLENPLTADGIEYVRESHRNKPTEITSFWMDYYGLNRGE